MSLKDAIRKAHGLAATVGLDVETTRPTLEDYVVPRHNAWLLRPEHERAWSDEALAFAQRQLAGGHEHERSLRISPSGVGDPCERAQLFSFAGATQNAPPISAIELMEKGKQEHLRFQMSGLTAGWLAAGETFIHYPPLRCGGSQDGICADRSLFELKNTQDHLFDAIVRERGSAKEYGAAMHRKHLLQMECYWLLAELTGFDMNPVGSLVYQRWSGGLYEFRVESDPRRRKTVHAILETLHDWIDIDQLPDMLDGCWTVLNRAAAGRSATSKEKTVFERCHFSEACPTAGFKLGLQAS